MSFYDQKVDINFNKPKLVDNKIIKKIKIKKMQLKKNSFTNRAKNICFDFIKENLGIVLILLFLAIILYLRYKDVKQRRKKLQLVN